MSKAKVQRKKVVIQARDYDFDHRYNQEMSFFDDVQVISVNVLKTKYNVEDGWMREEYLVFYQEIDELDESI